MKPLVPVCARSWAVRDEPDRRSSAETPGALAAPRSPGSLGSRAVLVLAAIGLLAIGVIAGRITSRPRPGPASTGIAGSLPRRTQVELNGQALIVPEGGKMPISPGRHTLTITLPRSERREYTFTVNPGEQVIFVPAPRNIGSTREMAEEPAP